jgi:hypothetical protein
MDLFYRLYAGNEHPYIRGRYGYGAKNEERVYDALGDNIPESLALQEFHIVFYYNKTGRKRYNN